MKKKKPKFKEKFYEKAQELVILSTKGDFQLFTKYLMMIGDDCRYAWHFNYLEEEVNRAFKENPLILFKLFASEYKDVFNKKELITMFKKINNNRLAKVI